MIVFIYILNGKLVQRIDENKNKYEEFNNLYFNKNKMNEENRISKFLSNYKNKTIQDEVRELKKLVELQDSIIQEHMKFHDKTLELVESLTETTNLYKDAVRQSIS